MLHTNMLGGIEFYSVLFEGPGPAHFFGDMERSFTKPIQVEVPRWWRRKGCVPNGSASIRAVPVQR